MRLQAKRDTNEREIIEALQKAGCLVAQVNDPGLPDLIVFHPQKGIMLMEVKAKAGRLTAAQKTFFKVWLSAPVYVVHSVEEALQTLDQTGEN